MGVWENIGRPGAIWGHHKILTSLIAVAKWGRVSPVENKHPPPLDKTISLAHFPDTLRLNVKPVSSPGAWAGTYRVQATLAACDFLSLCLLAVMSLVAHLGWMEMSVPQARSVRRAALFGYQYLGCDNRAGPSARATLGPTHQRPSPPRAHSFDNYSPPYARHCNGHCGGYSGQNPLLSPRGNQTKPRTNKQTYV